MGTVLIAVGAFVFYLIAYHTYGRWLARSLFGLSDDTTTPAHELEDGVDFVPSRKEVVFGHHFTSISGTGPIVGPAIAVIWGWLPALIWVLVGSVVMGAVHDFGAVVMSLRNRGVSIADLTGEVICRRAKTLLLTVVFFELLIVVAIFVLVIASVFAMYPQSVIPVWCEIPIAIVLGVVIGRAKSSKTIWVASIAAVGLMYVTVWIGYQYHISMPALLGFPPTFVWAIILFVYAFLASVLPVQRLLQPRDFINSHQLFIAMGLLFIGVLVAHPTIAAPATRQSVENAPAFIPFLFITVACGAISGFHALVGSGTSSKQISAESHAQLIGYGSMLTEGMLAVLVILAAGAGLAISYNDSITLKPTDVTKIEDEARQTEVVGWADSLASGESIPSMPSQKELKQSLPEDAAGVVGTLGTLREFRQMNGEKPLERVDSDELGRNYAVKLDGESAWKWHYRKWDAASGLGPKLKAFVDGAANLMGSFGIPVGLGVAIMGVFVASFAGTTLDTATRLQRYIIAEAGETVKVSVLKNRYVATAFVVVTAGALALWDGKGAGALVLWPLFGALNQLLASLALLILAVYLYRRGKPTWMVTLPLVFMLVMTGWAMVLNILKFQGESAWHLLIISGIVLVLQVWLTVEAAIIWFKVRKQRQEGSVEKGG
ncbi:MAG: carbon starvation protein A [Candidatus Brocadiia bacterium]